MHIQAEYIQEKKRVKSKEGNSCRSLRKVRTSVCHDLDPLETRRPRRPADLGSAIGLSPQSPGLLGVSQALNGGVIDDILAKESKFP